MREDARNRGGWREIFIALTPLMLGACLAGAGAFLAQAPHYQRVQLDRLCDLDTTRVPVTAGNPYEELAMELICMNRPLSGSGPYP